MSTELPFCDLWLRSGAISQVLCAALRAHLRLPLQSTIKIVLDKYE